MDGPVELLDISQIALGPIEMWDICVARLWHLRNIKASTMSF